MKRKTTSSVKSLLQDLPAARKKAFPRSLTPELCKLVEEAPDTEDWLHEIKYDGYRIVAILNKNKIKLFTRRGNDWSTYFPTLLSELQKIPLSNFILDGELIAFDRSGISNFQILQNAIHEMEDKREKNGRKVELQYAIFDIPYCEGYDLTQCPLLDRKNVLNKIFKIWKTSHPRVQESTYVVGSGIRIFKEACKHRLEGIISKKITSPYEKRRSRNWLKVKCSKSQEFVIGGITAPQGARSHFGALLLGFYDRRGRLIYCGRVGTGFTAKSLKELAEKFAKLKQDQNPFYDLKKSYKLKTVTWIKPKLVCEVEFSGWTLDGRLRHPSFQGLRLDKAAKSVVKESPIGIKNA